MQSNLNSYLSPKCEVRLADEKGGHTVVAKQTIFKGELVVVWSGVLVNGTELHTLSPHLKRHSVQVEEDHYLVSLTECEPPDYVNHSCNPNAGLSGQISLVALRDIRTGEEITYDYAMSDGSSYDEFSCLCGAEGCRGYISGSDWQRPELWMKYQGHFSPYLIRRINRLRKSSSKSAPARNNQVIRVARRAVAAK